MPRIITVTPNPSIDLLFEADTLVWDDANRVAMPRRCAGGQGINVTRAARILGGESIAVTLIGGTTGDELLQLLDAEGIDVRPAPAPGTTRTFVAVRERSTGRAMLINPVGPACGPAEETALLEELERCMRRGDWVVSSGSVPPGFDTGFHATVRDRALATGARVVVDGDGPALRAAAPGCTLLVPNLPEAERLLGRRIEGIRDAAAAATDLLDFGAETAVITMAAVGAVLASRKVTVPLHAAAPPAPPSASAVGAGDAFLAALLLHIDQGPPMEALRHAVAAGTAVLHASGGELLRREDVERLARVVDVKEAG